MEILPSELFLLFEVSLFWVEIEDEGLLLIVLSIEASSDVLFISWTDGAVGYHRNPIHRDHYR